MATLLFSSRERRVRRSGFTLIELLAVMAIIVVLAGLILGVASHANYKSSLARAQTEVSALSSAIEAYRIDNGLYPRSADTDNLVPQQDFDPVGGNNKYKLAAAFLYQELSGLHPASNGRATVTKAYYTFQPSQIDIAPSAPGTVTARTPTSPYMFAADPFGFAYGYSTAYLKTQEDMEGTEQTTLPDRGYNPTFDLWCTAGYSVSSGKAIPSNRNNAPTPAVYSSIWIKNW